MNDYLKELGQLAEIEEDILISATKGRKREAETFKKRELITTHTALLREITSLDFSLFYIENMNKSEFDPAVEDLIIALRKVKKQ